MGKTINDMVGATIQNFVEVYDYRQIVTDKGTINIYNPLKYYMPNGIQIESIKVQERDLVNTVMTNVEYKTDKYLKFEISHEKILKISLVAEDYCGPEAISVRYNTGEIIVFEQCSKFIAISKE